MCFRCLRLLLLALGWSLLVAAALPVMEFLHLQQPWVPAYTASKLLIMLPVGALCLLGAAGLRARLDER